MNSCSYGSSIVGLVICFMRFMVSVIFPYSCLLLSMWNA